MNLTAVARFARNYYFARKHIRRTLQSPTTGSYLREPLLAAIGKQPLILAAIEQRRWALLNDRRPITFVNFATGTSSDTAPPKEQAKGRATQLAIGEVARASKPVVWARLLYAVTKMIQPRKVLEIGTCVGISGAYIATALMTNGQGRLVTLEGNPASAEIAEETFQSLGVAEYTSIVVGPFQLTLKGELQKHAPIDLVFIDGHHQRDATISYFQQIRPHLAQDAVVIFDDIRWSEGMLEAWQRISFMPDLEVVDMGALGAVRLRQGRSVGRSSSDETSQLVL